MQIYLIMTSRCNKSTSLQLIICKYDDKYDTVNDLGWYTIQLIICKYDTVNNLGWSRFEIQPNHQPPASKYKDIKQLPARPTKDKPILIKINRNKHAFESVTTNQVILCHMGHAQVPDCDSIFVFVHFIQRCSLRHSQCNILKFSTRR